MKLDLHVHTYHSGNTTIDPLSLFLKESFYIDRISMLARSPLNWRRQAFVVGGLLGLPLVALPLAAALGHFILEERFNRALLFDLVKRPATRIPEAA